MAKSARDKAWTELKSAIDKYHQQTGVEVAVISTRLSEVDFYARSLFTTPAQEPKNLEIHGHGAILEPLREFMSTQDSYSVPAFALQRGSIPDDDDEEEEDHKTRADNLPSFGVGKHQAPRGGKLQYHRNNNNNGRQQPDARVGFNIPHSLPSGFVMPQPTANRHSLSTTPGKLNSSNSNNAPCPTVPNNSNSPVVRLAKLPEHSLNNTGFDSSRCIQASNSSAQSANRLATFTATANNNKQHKAPTRTKGSSKNNNNEDGDDEDLELDEFVAFAGNKQRGGNQTQADDDALDDVSEDDAADHRTSFERYGRYNNMQRQQQHGNDDNSAYDIAASLPVNIQYPMERQPTSGFSMRAGGGDRHNFPPLVSANADHYSRNLMDSETKPAMDDMLDRMQAMARSVTDDSSLIFGEKPRRQRVNSLRSFLQQR